MDSIQLEMHMRRATACFVNKKKNAFGGVIPADFLYRQKPTTNKCYIVNTDNSKKPGQHWIAIYVRNKTTVEYFDSYGIGPFKYTKWMRWLNKYFIHIKYNKKPVQSITSSACGAHCLFYLYHRLHNHSMFEILNKMYHKIREYNDLIVELDLEKHLKADIVIDDSILKRLIPQKAQKMLE